MKHIVGIIGAMDCEINEILLSMKGIKPCEFSGMTFYKGKIGKTKVVLVKSGVGKVFASIATQTLILNFGVTMVINTGVAGSISHAKIGDIVIASAVVQHDMDTSALGDPLGLISGINKVFFKTDAYMQGRAVKSAEALGMNAVIGVIASGDQFICKDADKQFIRDNFGALCVEMEGAPIGQVAYVNGVPFTVLRSISDDGQSEHKVEFATFAKESAKKVSALLIKMLGE